MNSYLKTDTHARARARTHTIFTIQKKISNLQLAKLKDHPKDFSCHIWPTYPQIIENLTLTLERQIPKQLKCTHQSRRGWTDA